MRRLQAFQPVKSKIAHRQLYGICDLRRQTRKESVGHMITETVFHRGQLLRLIDNSQLSVPHLWHYVWQAKEKCNKTISSFLARAALRFRFSRQEDGANCQYCLISFLRF